MGCTIWFTGLAAAGKSTLATALEKELQARHQPVVVLDADLLRKGLCQDLGFREADRRENVRRIGEVAQLFSKAGLMAICSCISPSVQSRESIRHAHQVANIPFIEVYVATPLSQCERWDNKGLYARARKGGLPDMVGIDMPYEAPKNPELILRPDQEPLEQSLQKLLAVCSP